VSAGFVLFILAKSVLFLFAQLYALFETYFMFAITIEAFYDTHATVMDWLTVNKVSKNSRFLIMRPGGDKGWDSVGDQGEDSYEDFDIDPTFSGPNKQNLEVPNRYQPAYGSYRFWHRGQLFSFSREKGRPLPWSGGNMPLTDERLVLRCAGRSTLPIKKLIEECQAEIAAKTSSYTVIRRPAPKELRQRGH
jgi:chaperone BCS1